MLLLPSMEEKPDLSPSVTCRNIPGVRLPTGMGPDSVCPTVSRAVPSPVLPRAFSDQGPLVETEWESFGVARLEISSEDRSGYPNDRWSASPHQFSKGTRTSPRSLAAKRRGSSGFKVKFLRGHREDGKNFILNANLPKWLHLHRHSSKTLQESYQATARETPGGKRTETGGSDPTFSALSRPKGCRGRSRPFVTERDQLRVTILLPQKRHVTLSAGRRYFSGSRPTVPELFSSTCDTNFASNTE